MQNLILCYDQPAKDWNEALPIGNGRLGAMVFGGTNRSYSIGILFPDLSNPFFSEWYHVVEQISSSKGYLNYICITDPYGESELKRIDDLLARSIDGILYFSYQKNPEVLNMLKAIIDALLAKFPKAKIVIQHPSWYSPNTQNGATYLAEGFARLQSYYPEIKSLVVDYSATHKNQVFMGDTKAFGYYEKKHLTDLFHEEGKQATFYLYPNKKGAAKLSEFWAGAIYKII